MDFLDFGGFLSGLDLVVAFMFDLLTVLLCFGGEFWVFGSLPFLCFGVSFELCFVTSVLIPWGRLLWVFGFPAFVRCWHGADYLVLGFYCSWVLGYLREFTFGLGFVFADFLID